MMSRFSLALKALQELGPGKLALYAVYRLGMRMGYFRRATQDNQPWVDTQAFIFSPAIRFPSRDELRAVLGAQGQAQLLAEADEIVGGRVRLFGGAPVPLNLKVESSAALEHWTNYQHSAQGDEREERGDVKFTWEAGRFGWAYTLGRAYRLSENERYPAAFWEYTEAFLDANPPYLGPHWVSAQEAALRLIALAFGLQVFTASQHSTLQRASRAAKAIAAHARRIPPTLIYARAQNNNHLLTEAAGLYTAGLVLPAHPSATRWRKLGWRWFNHGLKSQIAEDGAYMQHSANYQRLMLQAALWMDALKPGEVEWPPDSQERLAAATRWLLALLDPASGRVPNLGPNDGAYILPFTVCPFHDYRPVLQAAAMAFLEKHPFPPGTWDEMGSWFVSSEQKTVNSACINPDPPSGAASLPSPHVLRNSNSDSWAYLRAARFFDRPGHADQLHLDLWWRGLNVAQDAGSYLYNAPPPWDNALARTQAHNTVSVDGREQMRRAGRFLYLDWAQAQVIDHQAGERLAAQHDGYRSLGVIHQRALSAAEDGGWIVEDRLLPAGRPGNSGHSACLHWLLPDWPFELEVSDLQFGIRMQSPYGWIELRTFVERKPFTTAAPKFQLARAGELLSGAGLAEPTWGWSSPTYGVKNPALAFRLSATGSLPLVFTSRWSFAAPQG
ncbi:MAG: alginate lyase family protein [Anaerolineales bacterium]|nr:alginate lyase family protein [Anaerolineales bacterium]